MFNNESPIEIYYQSHPDATIKEFIDYTKEQDRRRQEAETERYNNCIDWYKNLEGRYFIINFNGTSFLAVYVDRWPSTEFNNKYQSYGISTDKYSIINEKGRDINRYWFKNPYEKPYFGQNDGSCKEITKEEFEDIAKKCIEIKNIVESINLK
jgi:hypothetical protein